MNDLTFIQNYKDVRQRLNKGVSATPLPMIIRKPPEPVLTVVATTEDQAILKRRSLLDGCPLPNRFKLVVLFILEEADIPWRLLFKSSRKKHLVDVRRKVFCALRDEGLSFLQIARYCGMDHSTVIYGIREMRKKEGLNDNDN